jgi:hypothetical protein
MQATTWIDRITDESTLWLNAVRSEDQHEFAEAARLYLKDASSSLSQGMPVWAALSCSCSADCLGEVGLPSYSRRLHLESARIYLERANSVATSSVREMLWALRQAYQQFLLADEGEKAKEAFRRMMIVSRRIDPFGADTPISLPERAGRPGRENEADDRAMRSSTLVADVESFLKARETGQYNVERRAPSREVAASNGRRPLSNEKSIINQLG